MIIGRNADIILKDYKPFNVFACAMTEARANTREILSGSSWGQRDSYHLTVNTTDWKIKELMPAVADFAKSWFGRGK